MELTTTVHKLTEVKETTSKDGSKVYKTRLLIVKQEDQYNPYLSIEAFGEEKCDLLNTLKEGDSIKVNYNIGSREYNDNWFTKASLWKFEKLQNSSDSKNDDLPF